MSANQNSELLDGLDRRLALGEIDLETYKSLRQKFMTDPSDQGNPVEAALQAMPVVARSLDCPGCMAPLPLDESDQEQSVLTCEYCGGTFTLGTAEEEMDRLRSDIQDWIRQLAGTTATGANVDEASRAYIFRERILPTLRTACERATEIYALSRHQALFSFPLMDHVSSSPFRDALAMTPDLQVLAEGVKLTVARLKAPEVQAFAVRQDDTTALQELQLGCQELVYLGNARRQISLHTLDGLEKAVSNLTATADLYESIAEASNDVSSAFYSAMNSRVLAVKASAEILRGLLSEESGFSAEEKAQLLHGSSASCEEAARMIELSGAQPSIAVPAAEGARADGAAIRQLANVVTLFDRIDLGSESGFPEYIQGLGLIVEQTRPRSAKPTWLGAFINALYLHVAALDGEDLVHSDLPVFDWALAVAEEGRRSSMLGGTEEVSVSDKVMLPFWVSRVCFSEKSGRVFKKGHAAACTVLIDASRHSGECVAVTDDAFCESSALIQKEKRQLTKSFPVLLPIVDHEEASAVLKALIASSEQYRGGYGELQSMVYLPVADVSYSGHKGSRQCMILPDGSAMSSFPRKTMELGAVTLAVPTSSRR